MILLSRLDSRQRIAGMTLGDGIVVMAMKNSVVEQLSKDIQKEFSYISGFSPDNLAYEADVQRVFQSFNSGTGCSGN